MTVRSALSEFERTREPFSGSTDPRSAGNGSLMRLAPAVLFAYPDRAAVMTYAADSSRHHAWRTGSGTSCLLFAALRGDVLAGVPKAQLFARLQYQPSQPKLVEMASGAFLDKTEGQIRGSGYCVESLEAALWCFFHTDSFEAAVLRAVNLGDDADTTGAIVGQIAGAYYGVDAIPSHWLTRLALRDDIAQMAYRLAERPA